MLDLDSPRWATIPASSGMNSALTVQLLRQARAGDHSEYGELFNQVCHQFTVGPAAYVAVPHLVEIARESSLENRVWPLSIVGSVEASRMADPANAPPLPEEWRSEYLAANEEAKLLTLDALRDGHWEPTDSQQLIATLAALHGHFNLAMHLFLQGGVTRLSCPMCGDYIEFAD